AEVPVEQEEQTEPDIVTPLETETVSKTKKIKKKSLKPKDDQIGQDEQESSEVTKETIEFEATEVPVEQEEQTEPDIVTPLETETVSKTKKIKKKSLKSKDDQIGQDEQESIEVTKETIEFEAAEVPVEQEQQPEPDIVTS